MSANFSKAWHASLFSHLTMPKLCTLCVWGLLCACVHLVCIIEWHFHSELSPICNAALLQIGRFLQRIGRFFYEANGFSNTAEGFFQRHRRCYTYAHTFLKIKRKATWALLGSFSERLLELDWWCSSRNGFHKCNLSFLKIAFWAQ